MSRAKKLRSEKAADSFTSMIDIVFLLLIFFLCQPFKLPEQRLAAELPDKRIDEGGIAGPIREDIRIRIRALPGSENNVAIQVDGRRVANVNSETSRESVDRIASMLKTSSLGDSQIAVAILPDKEVEVKHILTALDACYEARLPKVKFGFGN